MRKLSFVIVFLLCNLSFLAAQEMTIDEVISVAKTQSVEALQARSSFISEYWSYRSYRASRLPSLKLFGEVGSFDRSLRLMQNFQTGEMVYTRNFNMQNNIGLEVSQNVTLTGGTISILSSLNRLDQFGNNASLTWYAQPLSFTYYQPLFSYNQFKWDKLISPKEYEKALREYIEEMEAITIRVVDSFYFLMLSTHRLEMSRSNCKNTRRMLSVAEERMKLGTVTKDEYLQLELRMLNDSISVNENLAEQKEARMALNSILGYDETKEVIPISGEIVPEVYIDYEKALTKAIENSSFSLANDIDVLNAESAVAKAKANRGLSMQLNARFGLSNSATSINKTYINPLDQEIIGLSFSIPVFDWGMGKGRVKQAQAAANVIKAQVEQSEKDFRLSIFTAVSQFNNQRQQCLASKRARDIAAERYELMMEKFSRGNASVTELNTSQSENDSASVKYLTDIKNFWSYYYALRQLTLYDFFQDCDINVKYEELIN